MLDHDEVDAAIEYLARCVSVLTPQQDLPGYKNQLGDIHYMAGLLQPASNKYQAQAISSLTTARDLIPADLRIRKALAQQLFRAGRGDEAAAEMLAAIKINPADLSLKADLADLYERLGQFANAKPLLQELLAADPKHGPTHYRLAGVIAKLGDPHAAIQHYRQTLTDSPRMFEAANDLARLLAGHPDDSVRSADEALVLAQRLCAITKEKNAEFLDTLSIALANKGEFQKAISAANKAAALHPAEDTAAINSIRERIKLYEAGKPFRFGAPQLSHS
jgi:tetratricopeptide (TPR) repeat protein